MEKTPKVSILIISFNEHDYLQEAVRSCEKQSYSNIEIIIGDDGSTDGSLEMIKNMGDRIRFFVMPRDVTADDVIPSIRVSNLVKRGLDEATGEFFAILSGDDFYTDDRIVEEAVRFFEKNKQHTAYVSGFHYSDQAGNVIRTVIPKEKASWIYWSGCYTHISGFIFKKLDSGELLSRMCDDTGLQFVLAAKGKWGYSGKPVMAYRQREQSIQHNADQLELCLLEVMILQDIMNYEKKALRLSTESRFSKNCWYIKKHIDELDQQKYQKYLKSCEKYNNNPIKKIQDGTWTGKIKRMLLIRYSLTLLRRL